MRIASLFKAMSSANFSRCDSLEGKHPKGYQNRVFNSQKGHDGRSRPLYMGFLLSLLPRVNNTSSEQLRKEGEFTFTSNLAGICWVEALKTARVDAASNKIRRGSRGGETGEFPPPFF